MSTHSFGWLGRRRHAADPLTFSRLRGGNGHHLPLRPLEAIAAGDKPAGDAPAVPAADADPSAQSGNCMFKPMKT